MGGLQVYPLFGAALGYNDNVARRNDDPVSSEFLLLEPGIRADLAGSRQLFRAQYQISHAEFFSSRRDDYTDHLLDLSWRYTPTVRSDLMLAARWHRAHDPRGLGLRENFLETLDRDVDEFDDQGFDLRYTHGAERARGRVALFAGAGDKTYRNNRDFTREGDHHYLSYGAEFDWRFASRTSLLALARWSEADFDVGVRDSSSRELGFGLAWEGNTGDARVVAGRIRRDLDDPLQTDFSGTFWEAAATWRPADRSQLTVATRRATDAAFGQANFLVREDLTLGWRHQWASRLGSSVDLGWAEESFEPGGRSDDIRRYGLSVDYTFRRWLQLGFGWRHTERNSSTDAFSFEANEMLLSAQVSL